MPDSTPLPEFNKRARATLAAFRGLNLGEPARMHRRPTRDLASIIEDIRVKHRIGRAAPEDAVREAWPALVGEANASYSHPLRIEGRSLTVVASHSVVRNELFLHRAQIVARIQQLPSCKDVTNLHIKAG